MIIPERVILSIALAVTVAGCAPSNPAGPPAPIAELAGTHRRCPAALRPDPADRSYADRRAGRGPVRQRTDDLA